MLLIQQVSANLKPACTMAIKCNMPVRVIREKNPFQKRVMKKGGGGGGVIAWWKDAVYGMHSSEYGVFKRP